MGDSTSAGKGSGDTLAFGHEDGIGEYFYITLGGTKVPWSGKCSSFAFDAGTIVLYLFGISS